MKVVVLTMMLCLIAVNVFAAPVGVTQASPVYIKLLAPQTDGGKPLMQALQERRSTRSFSDRKLPPQVLSDLLWAAFGINRPGSQMRTAPSAHNMQEIDIYAVLSEGIYLYEPETHVLKPVAYGNFRALSGIQEFVADAPLNLIFVADYSRMEKIKTDAEKDFYAGIDTGFICQNVYLYCASAGLATVTRGYIEKEPLRKVMQLPPDQKIILAQTVGYAKTSEE